MRSAFLVASLVLNVFVLSDSYLVLFGLKSGEAIYHLLNNPQFTERTKEGFDLMIIPRWLRRIANAAVTKCYNCIEVGGSWSDCQRRQTRKECNAVLGNTHCYSASGKYDNGTAVLDVVSRGCIDCSDKKKACEKLELLLKLMRYELVSCAIACCTQDRCNTMIPTTRQSLTQPTSSGVLAMYSTSAKISLSMMLFVLTVSQRLVLF